MLKHSAINPPFWAIDEIASPFLNDFKEFVEEYKQQLTEKIEEEYQDDWEPDPDDEDEDQTPPEYIENLEELLNEQFSATDLSLLIQESLYESQDWVYKKMPKISLKNKKAEDILHRTNIYLKAQASNTKGTISFISPKEVEMRLFPCSILGSDTSSEDFDTIYIKFARAFYSVIRHELIHAIHFAYEHAEIQDSLIDTRENEEDDYYEDYSDADDDEGVNQGFEYYKQHRYAPPGKKPKSLPWDTETNLKINPPTDYYNNRFEVEAHPSDLALEAFQRISRYAWSKYKNKEDRVNYLAGLSQSSKGDAILTAFKFHAVSNNWLTGSQSYKTLLKQENYKHFLKTAYKNLESILAEYLDRQTEVKKASFYKEDLEEEGDLEYTPNLIVLPAGSILYHGTNAAAHFDIPDGPAFFSRDKKVAEKFMTWAGGEGHRRILELKTNKTLEMVEFNSKRDMVEFMEHYSGDSSYSTEEIVEEVCSAGFNGWVIPHNYGTHSDDILICNPEYVLTYIKTYDIDPPISYEDD